MALNFVKFQRGSEIAYNRLKEAGALEQDALYFIYNKNAPEDGGRLYLGETLIGGTNANGVSSLNDLNDINLSDTVLADGMILQYKATSGEWIPISLAAAVQAANNPISIQHGTAQEGQNIEQAINTINNNPNTGDIVFLDNKPYIYNGNTWESLNGEDIEDRVSNLEVGLAAVDGKITQAILNANHLTYTKVDTLPVITQSNVGDFNNKILLVQNSNPSENNLYDEYMVLDGALERVGAFGIELANYVQVGDLDNYVTKSDLSTLENTIANTYVTINTYTSEVGNIQDLIAASGKESTTIVEEILDTQEALTWQDLINDSEG